MPFNGAGTFTLNQDFVADAAAGSPANIISSTKVDNEFQNFKGGFEACLTITGETTPTADIPFGNYHATGLGQGTNKQDSVNVEQVTNGILNYAGTFGGTATVITATVATLSTSIPTGAIFRGLIAADTTGAATLNVNGGGAIALKNFDDSAIGAGDFLTGDYVTVRYDGTDYHVLEAPRKYTSGNPVYELTSVAGTADAITADTTYGSVTALATGQQFVLTPTANNTGAVTLNVDSIGAANVVNAANSALSADDLVNGTSYTLFYDGTSFRVMSLLGAASGVGLLAANNLSDLANAGTSRTNLGVAIGSDVQAYDAGLADIAGLAVTDGNIIVGDGANWVAESGATARTSLGAQAQGDVLDDLNTLGANSADSEFLVGTGAGALAWESGATVRTSLGLAIGTDVQAYEIGRAHV